MRVRALLLILVALVILLPPITQSGSDSLPHVKRSSSAIAIAPDGGTLLAVNPDSNSLSLVSLGTSNVTTEISVGVDPRTVAVDDTGSRAYVANRGSNSISVVNLTSREVITDVVVGDRPYGVIVNPDGRHLYVTVQGTDQLVVLDTDTFGIVEKIPMIDRPSGLAISADGRILYITHLLTNAITAVDLIPFTLYLPLVSKTQMLSWDRDTLAAGRSADTRVSRGASSEHNPTQKPTKPLSSGSDPTNSQSTIISLWPDSNLVQSIVLSPDGEKAYIPHTRSNTSNRALTFDTTVFPLISLVDLTTHMHLVGQQIDLGTLDAPGVGLPFDAAITSDGAEIWVLNAASNDISVVNLATRQLVAHIEVADNPRGIVLSPDGTKAYVNNTLAGTVSIIDADAYVVTGVITVTDIPLPPVLLNGKRLFHTSDDPRLSLAQWISCNTCHFEGEHDGRTWFFGFAGPRNTTSLLGMVQTYPLRWSGEWDESADAEFANRRENFGSGLIDGDMNCSLSPPDCVAPSHAPNQGRTYDLDSLAAFIDSLTIPLSPGHAHGEPLTEAEMRGKAILNDPVAGCITCHPAPLYTDRQKHDVGTATADERIGPEYDTPSLRGLYNSAPYFHDGSAATLYEALAFPSEGSEHDVSTRLTEAETQDLIAFLLALPYEE